MVPFMHIYLDVSHLQWEGVILLHSLVFIIHIRCVYLLEHISIR